GDGVEDWKVSEATGNKGASSPQPSALEAQNAAPGARILRVNFSSRVLGTRKLEVQLEQALKTFPEQVTLGPLRAVGAARERSQIGAASAPGIRLKTAEMVGLREIPVNTLNSHSDELLAYIADQPDWKLTLATERLAPRI